MQVAVPGSQESVVSLQLSAPLQATLSSQLQAVPVQEPVPQTSLMVQNRLSSQIAPSLSVHATTAVSVFVIAMLGLLYRKGPILTGQNKTNLLTALLTILMLGIIIGFISLRQAVTLKLGIFNIGIDSIMLGLIYIIGMSAIYKHEAKINKSTEKKDKNGDE